MLESQVCNPAAVATLMLIGCSQGSCESGNVAATGAKHVKMSASRSVSISSSLGMCRSHAQHHALWVCGSCSSCNGCCCRRLTCNSPHHLHVPPRELLWRSKLPPFLQLRSKVHPALHCAKECPALLLGQLMCACVQETS